MNFEDLNISDEIKTAIGDMGLYKLTPIQKMAIPPILKGNDVIGQAQTGSGKTMAFAISEQYRRFVEFAQTYVNQGNEDAIARDGGAAAGGQLAGRTITIANDNDYIKQWFRPGRQQNANNIVRDLFMQTICDMFGGSMANVPQEVKDAMELKNFNNGGHPLTARRIMFVKIEVDKIIAEATGFNGTVLNAIMDGNANQLPQDMQNVLRTVMNDLRTRFGEDLVPADAKITDVLNPSLVRASLQALANAANAEGRKLDAGAIRNEFAGKASRNLTIKVVGSHILARHHGEQPNTDSDPRHRQDGVRD